MSFEELPTRIIRYPDPRLRKKCMQVREFDDRLKALAERMLELMRDNRGVGLAACQAGIDRRIFVCNPSGEPNDDRVYVNPELQDLTGMVEAEEGCLSLTEVHVNVRRARKCRISAYNLAGEPLEEEGEGLIARIWQHEIDHINGVLIIDRMNPTDRIANKKAIAQLEVEFGKK